MIKWDVKYEKDVGDKDENNKSISLKRKKLLERLSILQNRKQLENVENKNLKEKSEKENLMIKESKELLKVQNRASRVIVREMRAYIKYKKEIDALKGTKGKKDKKGGKDKKGKKK